jgi:hypothetical protein
MLLAAASDIASGSVKERPTLVTLSRRVQYASIDATVGRQILGAKRAVVRRRASAVAEG